MSKLTTELENGITSLAVQMFITCLEEGNTPMEAFKRVNSFLQGLTDKINNTYEYYLNEQIEKEQQLK